MDVSLMPFALLTMIFAPIIFSVPILLVGRLTNSKVLGYISASVALVTLGLASLFIVFYSGLTSITVSPITLAPYDIPLFTFTLDPLALLFSFVVSFMGFITIWYSNRYMQDEEGQGRYYFLMLLFVGGMLVLVSAANVVMLYAGWEIVGICSFLLVGFWFKEPARNEAAKKVFFFTHIPGEALLLCAVGTYAWTGSGSIYNLLTSSLPEWQTSVLIVFALIAMFSKSAQFPFFSWLPSAMQGPTPVSALLHSATMVNAGVYLAARLFPLLAGNWLWILAIVGGFTLILAATAAIRSNDLKEVLAYSTISNLGYMFLAFGFGPIGLVAGLMQFLAHAFFKCCLFLGAGAVDHATKTIDLNQLGGLSKRMPYTATAFTIAALALAGVPPLCGFVSKWLIYTSGISPSIAGLQIFVILVLIGSVLSAGYILRAAHSVFYGQLPRDLESAHEAPRTMVTAQAILAAGCILVGVFAQYPISLIMQVPGAGAVTTQSTIVLTNIEIAEVSSFAPTLAAVLLLLATGAGVLLNEYTSRRPHMAASPSRELFGSGEKLPQDYEYSSGRHFLYQVTQPFERLKVLNPDSIYADIGRDAELVSKRLRKAHNGNVVRYAIWIFIWVIIAGVVFWTFGGL
jgi:NADH:ubiquinone oxidoreductase subunit 5 (subunit L)/multisubunit Na+/H+ antiporter MnhA subunit